MKKLILLLALTFCACNNYTHTIIRSNPAKKIKRITKYEICNDVLHICKTFKSKNKFKRIINNINKSGISEYYSAYRLKRGL